MLIEYTIAILAALPFAVALWYLPAYLNWTRVRWTHFEEAQRRFFENANALVADERTPEPLVQVLALFVRRLDDPRMMRRLVWRGLTGRLRASLEESEGSRGYDGVIVDAVTSMPDDLRKKFAQALVDALLANAYASGLAGKLFLDMMFADPRTRKETAEDLAVQPSMAKVLACAA